MGWCTWDGCPLSGEVWVQPPRGGGVGWPFGPQGKCMQTPGGCPASNTTSGCDGRPIQGVGGGGGALPVPRREVPPSHGGRSTGARKLPTATPSLSPLDPRSSPALGTPETAGLPSCLNCQPIGEKAAWQEGAVEVGRFFAPLPPPGQVQACPPPGAKPPPGSPSTSQGLCADPLPAPPHHLTFCRFDLLSGMTLRGPSSSCARGSVRSRVGARRQGWSCK